MISHRNFTRSVIALSMAKLLDVAHFLAQFYAKFEKFAPNCIVKSQESKCKWNSKFNSLDEVSLLELQFVKDVVIKRST